MTAMRDTFFNFLYEKACSDRNIIILSADFSAPSLDKFRLNIPQQYQFMGISEQNMMLVAAGLALEGKKVFCYAIAPFVTLRCLEQTKLYASGMDLPITLVGVGAGIAYEDSGYTHHSLEDISVLRVLPHMKVFQPCDNEDTEKIASYALECSHPMYVRLDRYGIDRLYEGEHDVQSGLSVVQPGQSIILLASGSMMKVAMDAAKDLSSNGVEVGVLNAETIPFDIEKFRQAISGAKDVITMEEHTLSGGLGSYVAELVVDLGLKINVKRVGFDLSEGYIEEFGGRDVIYKKYNMDKDAVVKLVKERI